MLAPLARRIVLARPVATALQTRPFSATTPSGDTPVKVDAGGPPTTEFSEWKRINPSEWLAEFPDGAARSELAKIRDVEDEIISTVNVEAEPIDWDHWRNEIRYPGLVDELKLIHDDTPMPDMEAEKKRLQQAVEDTFNPVIAELEKVAADVEQETVELEKRAADAQYLHDNIRELTVEEVLEKFPAIRESIEKDVKENRWFVEE